VICCTCKKRSNVHSGISFILIWGFHFGGRFCEAEQSQYCRALGWPDHLPYLFRTIKTATIQSARQKRKMQTSSLLRHTALSFSPRCLLDPVGFFVKWCHVACPCSCCCPWPRDLQLLYAGRTMLLDNAPWPKLLVFVLRAVPRLWFGFSDAPWYWLHWIEDAPLPLLLPSTGYGWTAWFFVFDEWLMEFGHSTSC